MDNKAVSHKRTSAIAWLVEFPGRGAAPGEQRKLTFVDASDPDYWGGQCPPGVKITRLVPAPAHTTNHADILAWLVQHRPVSGQCRYLTFVNPSDPDFWTESIVGQAMITALSASPSERTPTSDLEHTSGGDPAAGHGLTTTSPLDGIARETADKIMNYFFESTPGNTLKLKIRDAVQIALDRVVETSRSRTDLPATPPAAGEGAD
jgi:hypothetical protein